MLCFSDFKRHHLWPQDLCNRKQPGSSQTHRHSCQSDQDFCICPGEWAGGDIRSGADRLCGLCGPFHCNRTRPRFDCCGGGRRNGIFGGRGGLLGTIAGVLIIQVLSTMVVLIGLDIETQFIIKGLVILAAVTLYGWLKKRLMIYVFRFSFRIHEMSMVSL